MVHKILVCVPTTAQNVQACLQCRILFEVICCQAVTWLDLVKEMSLEEKFSDCVALSQLRRIAQEVSQSNATNWDRRPAARRALSRRLSSFLSLFITLTGEKLHWLIRMLALPVFTFGNQAGLDMLETTLVALQDIALQNL
ncbi:hypothetical protein RJ640_008573 [Escallonia rubra]|uniref:MEKHLA domain-containing protein n=1 Tax=Escallonia rubra TaxID=112253 RepID=A0AA88QIB7_9ASTE|nr:hypothetical protein RJ640_008573 [Escallonia rubra]